MKNRYIRPQILLQMYDDDIRYYISNIESFKYVKNLLGNNLLILINYYFNSIDRNGLTEELIDESKELLILNLINHLEDSIEQLKKYYKELE